MIETEVPISSIDLKANLAIQVRVEDDPDTIERYREALAHERKDVEHDMNDETKARVWVRPPCPALPDDAGSRGSNETDF